MSRRSRFALGIALSVCVTSTAAAQVVVERDDGPRQIPTKPPTTRAEARPWHVRRLMAAGMMTPDSALALLDSLNFSAAFRERTPRPERLELVRKIGRVAAQAADVRVNEDDAGVHIRLGGGGGPPQEVLLTFDDHPPFGILTLSIRAGTGDAPAAASAIAWDDIAKRVREAEAAGLAGQILVRRGGRVLLRESFGLADQASNRRTSANEIYCIGSTPIDFTSTAAQLLAARGKLDLDAPVSRYLPNVPSDKATLTSRMILDGKSGLPNFHGTSADWDQDLAWIDRATAVRRILAMPLLSAPGTERSPSHSAFGLLAAVIEAASGTTYPEFVRGEILKPLGMTRTGFYGETLGLSAADFATGYGTRSAGLPNIPPNWGPTSWLVMGSGGMFSTLDDLQRFYDGMAAGTLFGDGRSRARAGATVGGSDRGFYVTHIDNGKGDQILLMTNVQRSPSLEPLARGLMALVLGR